MSENTRKHVACVYLCVRVDIFTFLQEEDRSAYRYICLFESNGMKTSENVQITGFIDADLDCMAISC